MWGEDPDPVRRLAWLEGVYTDTPLATRLRDGELLSSSSQPSLMAKMLADLRVHEGDRVLEIGAGTGWNAALLAYRLGSAHVTTVDLDPDITDSARRHLEAAGLHPHVVTGDGARGCRADAPYDRVLATCALDTVPRPWLEQTRPGGLILTPFATGLVRLTVHGPDRAEGRFLPTPAYFVRCAAPSPAPPATCPPTASPATCSTTRGSASSSRSPPDGSAPPRPFRCGSARATPSANGSASPPTLAP